MDDRRSLVDTVFGPGAKGDCRKHALVLEALGIEFETRSDAAGFTLVVAAADAARARQELEAYAYETRDRPDIAPVTPRPTGGLAGVIGYVAVLLLVAFLEHRHALARDWFSVGKTHAGLMRDGQWWRAVTALSLHSDIVHLAANVVFGGLIGLFAGQLLGSGLAWFSILIAGTTGNMLLALIRPAHHTSVGASTAVFAALGIVAAYVWMRRRHEHTRNLKRWAPLIGGALLLAYLGTGGERTDVAAHVTGFLSGLLLGALYGKLGNRLAEPACWIVFKPRVQLLLGFAAATILTLAWLLALTLPSN